MFFGSSQVFGSRAFRAAQDLPELPDSLNQELPDFLCWGIYLQPVMIIMTTVMAGRVVIS